jgi:L-serine kinase (ADP)
VDLVNLEKVKREIAESGVFKEPIIIDSGSLTVLDGHHRLQSCRELGLKTVPCLLVNYMRNPAIRVVSRRPEFKVSKRIVVAMGLSGKVFPCKTTKHFIPHRIRNLKIPLSDLK